MVCTINRPKQAKKDYTDSLFEEIEKETPAVIGYYNAYVLKNLTEFNYRWIRKICSRSRQKGPKSSGEAMTQGTCRDTYPLINVNLAHEKRKCQA
jgi:hypothetical protein